MLNDWQVSIAVKAMSTAILAADRVAKPKRTSLWIIVSFQRGGED